MHVCTLHERLVPEEVWELNSGPWQDLCTLGACHHFSHASALWLQPSSGSVSLEKRPPFLQGWPCQRCSSASQGEEPQETRPVHTLILNLQSSKLRILVWLATLFVARCYSRHTISWCPWFPNFKLLLGILSPTHIQNEAGRGGACL